MHQHVHVIGYDEVVVAVDVVVVASAAVVGDKADGDWFINREDFALLNK